MKWPPLYQEGGCCCDDLQTFGNSSNVAQITINSFGRVIEASNVAIGGTVVSNISSSNIITSNSYYIGVLSNGAANITVTMPLGLTLDIGKTFIIKDESGKASINGYRPVIQMSGTDLLDGQSTTVISVNYAALQIMWVDGKSNTWSII